MATSSSSNYNQTRNEIISDTLQLLGVIGSGETANANDITFCSNILNKMIKAWQSQGIHLWQESEGTLTLTADEDKYVLSSSGTTSPGDTELTTIGRPLNIVDVRYHYNGGNDRQMRKLGRVEYMQIPNKTAEGASTAYYFSPQRDNALLYIWPVPDNSDDTLKVTYIRSIEDFDASSDNPDFPSEWLEAITYNLAIRVAPAFGITLSKSNPDLIMLAATSLEEAKAWDSEEGSLRIVPNYRNDD